MEYFEEGNENKIVWSLKFFVGCHLFFYNMHSWFVFVQLKSCFDDFV